MVNAILYISYLFLSCWKLIFGEGVSKLFRNTPYVSKHFRWGGQVFHQHPRVPPHRTFQSIGRVSKHPPQESTNNSRILRYSGPRFLSPMVEFCRLTPFCPNPPKQSPLPYLQLHLQVWTLGVSGFMLGFIWQQLSTFFLPLLLQARHKLKSCCWTAGDSAPGATSYLGPDTSRFIVA